MVHPARAALLATLLLASAACISPPVADNVITTSEDGSGDSDDEGPGNEALPATYRFECLDVRALGDAGPEAVQAQLLESSWSSVMNNHGLNILVAVDARDEAAGTADLQLFSGVGTTDDDLCTHPETASGPLDGGWSGPDAGAGFVADTDACAVPGDAAGTYSVTLSPEDAVRIFSREPDGTPLNCTPDPKAPDAVTLRAVQASLSIDATEEHMAGVLTGCLLESEGLLLCACLAKCAGDGPQDINPVGAACEGCPVGGLPLVELLDGINPSTRCSDLMGEPAYDFSLGFSARRLAQVPTGC